MTLGRTFVQKISRLREEPDQGYVPNDQSYVLDDSDVNSDSTIPPTRIEAILGCECIRQFGRSFIYSKNKRGPKIVPCGTPQGRYVSGDLLQLTRHVCIRFLK